MQPNMQVAQLREIHSARCIGHHTRSSLRFRKGNHVANGARTGHQHNQAIQTESQTTVGRSAEFQRIQQETEFFALLLGAGWTAESALVDPFCGSGTIPIEAALMARRMPPGGHREFAFARWPEFDAAAWAKLVDDARAGARTGVPVPIVGSDRDAGAIEASIANAQRAGVAHDVEWHQRPVSAMERVSESGLVAANPPYGKRIGGGGDVRNVYAQTGNVMRRLLGGWNVAFYIPDSRLAGQTGLTLKQEFRTVNGGIRVGAWIGAIPRR